MDAPCQHNDSTRSHCPADDSQVRLQAGNNLLQIPLHDKMVSVKKVWGLICALRRPTGICKKVKGASVDVGA